MGKPVITNRGEMAKHYFPLSKKNNWVLYRTLTASDSSVIDLATPTSEVSDDPVNVELATIFAFRLRAVETDAQVVYKIIGWDKSQTNGEVLKEGTLIVSDETDDAAVTNLISAAVRVDVFHNAFIQVYATVTNIGGADSNGFLDSAIC